MECLLGFIVLMGGRAVALPKQEQRLGQIAAPLVNRGFAIFKGHFERYRCHTRGTA